MPLTRDTFCSYCGAAYATPLRYPRTCTGCSTTIWANPIPVAVVILPVTRGGRDGIMVIRRAEPPQIGKLALAGGFVEEHEGWAEGAAREVREEAGVIIDPKTIAPYWFTSTAPRPNRVLLFGVAAALEASALPPFVVNAEVSERGIVFGPGGLLDVFAFPLHAEAARRYFADRGIDGPHDFMPV